MMMDKKSKWAIIELSHVGEKKSIPDITTFIRNSLGDGAEIFIPQVSFTRRDSTMTICLMEGYVFVEASLPPANYLFLEDLPYFERVLTRDEPEGRFLCYVDQDVIDDLKRKLAVQIQREIKIDDHVLIVEGVYSELEGRVLGLTCNGEKATVHIEDLKSMEVIVELPLQFLEKVGDS
jgi:transcription antitermination factor NusG